MDDNTLALIESRTLDHKYDVKALINEVRYLKAVVASLTAERDVSDKSIDTLQADIVDEINCEAIDYTFGTYGHQAVAIRAGFVAGAYKGINISARIVQDGK